MVKKINNSQIISLKSEGNRCLIGFFLDIAQISDKKTLFLTYDNHKSIQKELKHLKENYKKHNNLDITYLFFKDNFHRLYKQYDKDIFKSELLSLIDDDYDLFYLHRIDLFPKEIEDELVFFINALRHKNKKVIFSSFDQVLYTSFSDLSLDILYEKNRCILEDRSVKEDKTVVLISNNQDMIKLHKKLFVNQKNILFKTVDLEDLHKEDRAFLSTVDLIIYHDSRKILDTRMTASLKIVSPFSKILYITNKESLREDDLKLFKEMGIEKVYGKNPDIKRYIYDIEDILENNFYSKRLKNITFDDKESKSYKDFLNKIDFLEKNSIIFTTVSVNIEDIINKKSISIRDGDFYFIDTHDRIIVFTMLHLFIEDAKKSLANRFGIDKKFIKEYKKDILSKLVADA